MPQTAFHTASGAVLFVLQGSRRDRRKITKQVTEESHSFQDSDRFLSQKNEKKYYYRAHYSKRGCSSVGRATGSQSVGRGFDPLQLHQKQK